MTSQRAATSEVSIFNLPGTTNLDDLSYDNLAAPEPFHPAVPITLLFCGWNLVAFVTVEHRLYLMDLRQQPAQHDTPRIVQALRSEKVKTISCGCSHVVVLTTSGAAYRLEVGSAADLDSGRGAALAASGKLVHLPLPGRVSAVSCGESHVLMGMDSGAVFAFGDGSRGQLGLGHSASKEVPVQLSGLSHVHVNGLAAGRVHSCAISSLGALFTWGDNRHGQLGDGSTQSKSIPHLLKSLEGVCCVVAHSATAAICTNGSSYAWGFGKWHVPIDAFHLPVGRLALAKHVLCGVSLSGELLLRGLTERSFKNTFIVQRGVAEVAAADGHVVSLGGAHPTLSILSPKQSPAPGQMFQRPQPTTRSPNPFSNEMAELEASNAQLNRTLDEIHAESFFEMASVQRAEHAASQRSMEALLALEKDRTELNKTDNLVQLLRLQEEVESLRAEVEAECDSTDMKNASDKVSGLAVDAVTRDLSEKCAQLTDVHARLCEERDAVQAEISMVRTGLAESGQRLKRIEDTCVRTSAMVERRKSYLASIQQEVSQAELELRRAEARLPFVVDEGSRLEQAAQNARREALRLESVELQQEKDEWSRKLADLHSNLEKQRRDDHQWLGEARRYTQEHANEERSLAEQQLICSRLEGEVVCLQSEHSQAQKQALDLHQFSSRSQRDVKKAADDALQHCNFLRTQIGSGDQFGLQRASLMKVVSQLVDKLTRANIEHTEQTNYLREHANKFAEETAPLYSEVQRLHAALTNLRKFAIDSSEASQTIGGD